MKGEAMHVEPPALHLSQVTKTFGTGSARDPCSCGGWI